MNTIFTVQPGDLDRLSAEQAVFFFRELLWAEAARLGIAKGLINVPSAINVADGGVDAEVGPVESGDGQGLVSSGLTRFQVKTGAFSPSKAGHVNALLLKKDRSDVHPRVKACFDQGGRFVVVLFGWDNPEQEEGQLLTAFRQTLTPYGEKYGAADIEVWGQSRLVGFLSPFPSLSLRVNGRDHGPFQSHRSWSGQEDMRSPLRAGLRQVEFVENLREQLRVNSKAVHVRVLGDPGAGKTKLVLEATRAADLAPSVVYCSGAALFRDTDLMNLVLRDDNDFVVVLVIDECDSDNRAYLWNKLSGCGPRVKLVTIHNELEQTSGETLYMEPPVLEEEQISEIIQGYGIPADQAGRWSELCGGSPRVAHVVGTNLLNNPEDLLRTPDTVNVWDRYVAGGQDISGEAAQRRRLVLRFLSLFRKCGMGGRVDDEARHVAALVKAVDPAITWGRFQEVVGTLRARKILQGETTLYITPKALHIRLWAEWWDTYGEGLDLEVFMGGLKGNLGEWFRDMFKYAAQSNAASRVVQDLLGPDGPFRRDDALRTELGGSFFLSLTEADPEQALRCLQRTVGGWSSDEISSFSTGRQYVVWSLERMAIWRDLFCDAARILLQLAEFETATNSNNSTGVFVGLFSNGVGRVAPTEAAPAERFPILEESLASSSPERRRIALIACDAALSMGPFSRILGAEDQGLRQNPELWTPATYGELFESYRRVWRLLDGRVAKLVGAERTETVAVLLKSSRSILLREAMQEMVLGTLESLVERAPEEQPNLLKSVLQILHYEGRELSVEVRERLEKLRDGFSGPGFSARMKRFVGTDLLEDSFDEDGSRLDQKGAQIRALVEEALDDPSLLRAELAWLVTPLAEDGFRFGVQLGRSDPRGTLAEAIVGAQRGQTSSGSLYFLGGYLRGVSEVAPGRVSGVLAELANDPETAVWVPELTWRSNQTDQAAAQRVLGLIQNGAVEVSALRMFVYGGYVRNLDGAVLAEWIEYLLAAQDRQAVSIAMDLVYMSDLGGNKLKPGTVQRVLLHDSWFEENVGGQNHSTEDYHWAKVARGLLERSPDARSDLVRRLVDNFGREGAITDSHSSPMQALLTDLAREDPKSVWSRVARHLEPPYGMQAFHLSQWLRGRLWDESSSGGLSLIPPSLVWTWIEGDVEGRAWYAATFVPKDLGADVSLFRELLARYGHLEEVRRNLHANFATGGWSGPESVHFTTQREFLLQVRAEETDQQVLRWLDEHIEALGQQIERARVEEERDS